MTIKELFDMIVPDKYSSLPVVVENVPVLPNGKIDLSGLNGKYSMSFKVLDSDDTQKYEASRNKKKFQGTTESIHVWNLEINEYFDIVRKYDTAFHLIKDRLSIYSEELSMKYLYISHMILHEIGHYKQYLDLNRKVYIYLDQDRLENERIHNQQNQLKYFLQTDINFGIVTQEKLDLYNKKMEELNIAYRQIPNDDMLIKCDAFESELFIYI